MADYIPLINGVSHSWVDIVINLLGVPVAGVRGIKYDETQEKTNNYGSGRRPVSRGYGKIETTGSITLMSEEILALEKAAPNGNILDIPPFEVIVSYIPKNSTNICTDVLHNCEFTKNARDAKEGDVMLETELDLVISHVDWNV